jgi:uncharacterized protein (DUF1778 family)
MRARRGIHDGMPAARGKEIARLMLSMTKEEKREIDAAAAKAGVDRSTFMREAAIKHSRGFVVLPREIADAIVRALGRDKPLTPAELVHLASAIGAAR